MKPPVDLIRPGILSVAVTILYFLAVIFHIIAFAVNNWSSFLLDEVQWNIGLWQGCRDIQACPDVQDCQNLQINTKCKTDIFYNKIFQACISGWYTYSRVTMVLSLIILFVLEFLLFGYTCVKRLQTYKTRLGLLIGGLSVLSGICHIITLVMFGSVKKVPNAKIHWPFGMVILCLLFEIILPLIIYLDTTKRFNIDNIFCMSQKKEKHVARPTTKLSCYSTSQKAVDQSDSSNKCNAANNLHVSNTRRSSGLLNPSLSAQETYRKYAYLDVEPSNIISSDSELSINIRSGRSGAYTNTAYVPDDTASIESTYCTDCTHHTNHNTSSFI